MKSLGNSAIRFHGTQQISRNLRLTLSSAVSLSEPGENLTKIVVVQIRTFKVNVHAVIGFFRKEEDEKFY